MPDREYANLELDGLPYLDPETTDAWAVAARFANASPELFGELTGTLKWKLSAVRGLGLVTRIFELRLRGDAYSLELCYRGSRTDVVPGFTATGKIVLRDQRDPLTISFKKGWDEVAWLRTSGPFSRNPF